MADTPAIPLDQLRTQNEELITMIRKGISDLRLSAEASRDAVRDSRRILQSVKDITTSGSLKSVLMAMI